MRRPRLWFAAIAMVFAVLPAGGCSNDDPYDDGGNGNQTVLSGTIDGSPWAAVQPLAARTGPGSVGVSVFGGDAQNRHISIDIDVATGPGTYTLSSEVNVSLELGSQIWPGFVAGQTGTVTLTTLTTTYMVGSFNVTLQPQTSTGASGPRTLVGTFTAYFGQT